MAVASIEIVLPRRPAEAIDVIPSIVVPERTDKLDPNLANDLSDKLLPRIAKSNVEVELPSFETP